MRYVLAAAIITLSISPAVLHAKGCIKGAVAGGVAGSTVGHGKLGAAAGCAVGHHEANKADSQKNAPRTTGQAK
jgi:outer membrane lipoprotein SlyB